LIGATGSGKSSLLDLLYALRDPAEGFVQLDGMDFRNLRLRDIRSNVALVRNPEIFEGTVLENLRAGNPGLSLLEAQTALELVGLFEDIQAMPDGMSTHLATGGQPLSNGQSIQLELARALCRYPRFMILDECLDQLDGVVNREKMLDALFDPNAPWTLLVTTEDPALLARCTQVYELSGGVVREYSPRGR
jgi:ABC-type bacteriocin/lantibiotic exporter with double-glycine peptidase domain